MKGNPRHVVQFQLGVLELERTRREQERRTAQQKVDQLDGRLRQIDVEIREREDTLGRHRRPGRHSKKTEVTGR